MSRVLFVSPTYITKDTAEAFEKHKQSIRRQKGDFLHVIVNDCSPVFVDDTVDGSKKVVMTNGKNEGSPLASAMKAIKKYSKPDDIIAIVDGDDWLLVDNIPEVLNSVYSQDVELAWSNFLCSDGTPGFCQWIPETVHPRDQWFTSHLKTFRASLLDRVDDGVLRDKDGEYVKYAGDCALYWALMEKAYKRLYIPLFLYGYNVGNPASERFKDSKKVAETTKMLQERKQYTRGQPTKRGVLDTGRVCNEKCKFCYYSHEEGKKEFVPITALEKTVKTMVDNGREWIDLTGGEPSIHPDIGRLVDYIHSVGAKVCMISNGLKGFDFGCDDYLISLHGSQETHDKLVGHEGAYDVLMAGVDVLIEARQEFRFNCVINKENANELPLIAEIMAAKNPKICNFINFNPYYNWAKGFSEEIQAKYSDFVDGLKKAIDILVAKDIGVTVRYLPFCQLKGYERHICGIMQHAFDDYEWLNKDMTTVEALNYSNGIRTNNNLVQNNACTVCALQEICDSPNKQYASRFGIYELKPYMDLPKMGAMDILKFRFTYDKVFRI